MVTSREDFDLISFWQCDWSWDTSPRQKSFPLRVLVPLYYVCDYSKDIAQPKT